MIGLLAYGSLMHPDELSRQFARAPKLVPVRVRGYRRGFCQEPSWRPARAGRRGVLTVRPSARHWINAVLVRGCDAEVLSALDHRERGYHRVRVPTSAIEPYDGFARLSGLREVHIYRGRPELSNPRLTANPEYLGLCTEAAARWGESFLDDFLRTTHQGGIPLGRSG